MTIAWGCALPSPTNKTDYRGIAVSQADAGQQMTLVGWYGHWLDNAGYSPFPKSTFDYVRANGSTSVFCWQVTNSSDPITANSLTAASILRGDHDDYIEGWAANAAAWGDDIYLRILHEFDGNWYSWSVGNNDWTTENHVAVWRYIVRKFSEAGVFNVFFVWCPSRVTPTNQSVITAAFPGNWWVDYMGCDGYNFGPYGGHGWQTAEQVFDATLLSSGLFTKLAPHKPQLICEVGCAEDGIHDKGAWISHFFGYVVKSRYPNVQGVCWMQNLHDDGRDNHFESSPQAWDAFKASVGLSYYRGTLLLRD